MVWLHVAAALVIAFAGWASFNHAGDAVRSEAYRFTIPPPGSDVDVPVVSPDGRQLVYVTGAGLLLRALDEDEAVRMDGTAGAREPFWSPDSPVDRFFSAAELREWPPAAGCRKRSPQCRRDGPRAPGRPTGPFSSK